MSQALTPATSLQLISRVTSASHSSRSAPLSSYLRRLFPLSLRIEAASDTVPAQTRRYVSQGTFLLHSEFSPQTVAEMGQTKPETTPYGAWRSPLTADFVSAASKRLGGAAVDSTGRLLWLEGRPSESGRSVLVREGDEAGSAPEDITPAGFNVRTVVHEYGGGAFKVKGDCIVFSNYADQRLYKQSLNSGDGIVDTLLDCEELISLFKLVNCTDRTPVALTPAYEGKAVRYADGEFDTKFHRLIVVREVGEDLWYVLKHSDNPFHYLDSIPVKSTARLVDNREAGKEAVNEIVAVELDGAPISEPKVLVKGNDFYMFPRLSPDGRHLAWMEWSHPNMPWDRTSIWVGQVSDNGDITSPTCVAGGDKDTLEAPTEPRWSPQGDLFFVSDRDSGFWNLYRWSGEGKKVKPLHPLEAEFTRPAWIFGNSSFAFLGDSGKQIVCTYRQRGESHLATVDLSSGNMNPIKTPFTDIYGLFARGNDIYLSAGSAFDTLSLVKVTLVEGEKAGGQVSVAWSSLGMDIAEYKPYFSTPKVVEFPTKVTGETAFANFYPPCNVDYVGPSGERPPLLVRSHGGPTSEAKTTLDLAIQYWTSRGWAFADVNYGGSTGYGREFRERLYGQWGVVDVNDCCSCAEYLVSAGEVDAKRLCIDGRSAGGYTTMAALVFSNTFTAGASLYGLSDLTVFITETHKFESRYLNSLIGMKDQEKTLHDRSPINFLDNLSCPIILFQGLEDKVVPPNQARLIYDAVKAKGIPVALVEYEGEQHGFLKAENIQNTLEQEMVFFARLIGGFQVADPIVPMKVDNFDK